MLSLGPGAVSLTFADLVVHQQVQGLGVGVDGEIRSMRDGMQEGVGHRPATAAPLVDVKVRTAVVASAIEFLDRLDAHFGSGGLPRVQDLPAHAWPLDGDLATR